jgi:hypothetical protein
MYLDLALKSPGEEYRFYLKEAIKRSGKIQSVVALEAEIEPANLSNMIKGRRKPLLNYKKNLALAEACSEGAALANELQLAAEASWAIDSMPQDFRRYIALAVRTLEVLMERTATEIEALEDLYRHGDITDTMFVPESLLAARKVVNSLRYWWPVEANERWDDYRVISDRFQNRLRKLSPEEQVDKIVQWEVDEALEWVRERGDLDPELEKRELIRRLAMALGVDDEQMTHIAYALEEISGRNFIKVLKKHVRVEPFGAGHKPRHRRQGHAIKSDDG